MRLNEVLPHLEQLEAALAASDTQLLIKGHLYDRLALPRRSASISLVANDEELGAILGDVDGVITDYSSVMFDAALIGLPVIFTPSTSTAIAACPAGRSCLTTTTWSANAPPGASTS